jgi:hypothetical protein
VDLARRDVRETCPAAPSSGRLRRLCRSCRPGRRARRVALAALAVLLLAEPALAEPENESIAREGAFGAGAALVSFAYGPLKIAYAVGGLVLGGLSFLWTWGDRDVTDRVVSTALAGDYVITPDHLEGAKDFDFAGDE